MDEIGPSEIVELDAERFIQLEGSRRWPKYVMAWSVRQRAGDSDFPLAEGEVERMPPDSENLDEMWQEMRDEAAAQAMKAAEGAIPPEPKPRSFLDRLLGRS